MGDTTFRSSLEPAIPVLLLGLVLSLALTALVAMAALARTGLRGRRVHLWSGFGLGLLAGGVELVVAVQLVPITRLLTELGQSVWFEIGVEAAVAALTYFVVLGAALQLGLLFRRERARRSGDVVSFAAGLGSGMALTATLLKLAYIGVWPPSALFVAVVYPPVQLCFTLLLAAATLAAREGLAGRTLGWQATAILVQTGYQFVFRANDTIGHWLAWLEPGRIGVLWLGLIILAWLLGLAVMAGLSRAEPEPPHSPADPGNGLLQPTLWLWLAGLVLVPAALVFVLGLFIELDARIAWVMVLALLATPVMAGALLLRTAWSLRRGQRPEWR